MKVTCTITSTIVGILVLSFLMLTSSTTLADVVDDVVVTVPVSCNITDSLDTAHTATINPGQYQSDIGTTNFTVFCNDNSGYSIYAIGYSNEEYGNTKMLATINNELSPTNDINTGTNTSGANSSWSMKLIPVTTASSGTEQPYTPTIESDTNGSFSNYHIIPAEYTKVATFTSNTDFTIGSSLQSTYQVYIDNTKPAGTYAGKVKYTLVHPNDEAAPIIPAFLDTGQTVNAKMKSLAAGEAKTYNDSDSLIKSIQTADSLPADFEPTEANTISLSTSDKPVYIFFDNANDVGIMYVYSGNATPVLNSDSSYMFYGSQSLFGAPVISNWDTSNVTNMTNMFAGAGYNAANFSLDLSNWDTSNVTNMTNMFASAGNRAANFSLNLSNWDTSSVTHMIGMFHSSGQYATTWTIGGLSSWDTSSVTNMGNMFNGAGQSVTDFTLDLSSWNTSKVVSMNSMFYSAGNRASSFTLDFSNWDTSNVVDTSHMFNSAGQGATDFTLDLSSWNTSSVTNMSTMFSNAGYNATTWTVTIPKTNDGTTTGPISNTTFRLYGKTTSTSATPPSSKSFTLAQP